jgi:hypothetical protein
MWKVYLDVVSVLVDSMRVETNEHRRSGPDLISFLVSTMSLVLGVLLIRPGTLNSCNHQQQIRQSQ